MKIGIPTGCSGHLSEMLYLLEAFADTDVFFIISEGPRVKELSHRHYTFRWGGSIPGNLLLMLRALPRMIRILRQEHPDVLVSTGGEFALPFLYLGKLFGAKIIFIESVTRVHSPTGTGRLVYPISDLFLVQHPELLKAYGKKASYEGGIV